MNPKTVIASAVVILVFGLLVATGTAYFLYSLASDNGKAEAEELHGICVRRKAVKQALKQSESIFLQCMQSGSRRIATGTDDESDIVAECRDSAFSLSGVFSVSSQEFMTKTDRYADKCGEFQ